MEKIAKIRKVEIPSTPTNYFQIKKEMEVLTNRLRLLNIANSGIMWKTTQEMELLNITIDKEMLENSKNGEDCYIGKGYKLVEFGFPRKTLAKTVENTAKHGILFLRRM